MRVELAGLCVCGMWVRGFADGCEVRLCDPCGRVCPGSPRCLFTVTLAGKTLQERSIFRNERDVVPAAFRAGPKRRNFIFYFFERCVSLQRDAEVESF